VNDSWGWVALCVVVAFIVLLICGALQPFGLGRGVRRGCVLAGYDVAVVTWDGTAYCVRETDLVPYWEGVE